ncbi:MAG TPA: sensor histidine kinase KdpD [Dermatophilaceae bacterium]|jgi:two-component system, OmpR family, sensor histidine kinase KdpD
MTRGRLRIYLGAAPGVGKTVAMLGEGHRRLGRGTDVVVGLCETHGRGYTAAQIEGLESVPLREIEYRAASFRELDVDAVLARAPQVALVDELAHTNVPGSRNTKRWEDIHELLDAGIDVISTVNIQHLESLNDVVESITGVKQRETVPDDVVRAADQIELVDMTPEALRRRMAHGNVYAADKVNAALSNYFRPGNLSALRELALLWLADRVDEALDRYRHDQGISATWPTRERIVVAVNGQPEGETLLRRAAQIVSRSAGGELMAAYVTQSDGLVGADLKAIATQRKLTAELGGTFHSVTGDDVAQSILDFARGVNATQIVLGVSRRGRLRSLLSPGVGETVVAGSGDIDVHLVIHDFARKGMTRPSPVGGAVSLQRVTIAWLMASLGLGLSTWLLVLTRESHDLPLNMLVFLALTVTCALVGGLWPALFCAVASSLALNFFFTPPIHTLTISDPQNAAVLVVFVLVATGVASVVHLSARRTAEAVAAERESRVLAQLAHSLLGAKDQLPALLDQARTTFGMQSVAIVRRGSVREPWEVLASTGPFDVDQVRDASVRSPVDDLTELVLCGRVILADEARLVSAFATHAAAILSREELVHQARAATSLAKDSRTRTALLAAVSHDLRTPLASIKAAASSLRQDDITWSAADQGELLESIEQSADRLNAMVGNLLDMSRLQTGSVNVHLQDLHLLDVLKPSISDLGDQGRRVRTWLPEDLPLFRADAGLLDRVLANVLENALKHSPGRQEVVVSGSVIGDQIQVRVVDRGIGVPDNAKQQIFAPFQRFGDSERGDGVGLGLAVARGLTESMDGTLSAEDTPGGGLTIVIELPLTRAPQ